MEYSGVGTHIIESNSDEFFELAKTTAREDILGYITQRNKENNFPNILEVDSYVFDNYRNKVRNTFDLSSFVRGILKEEGVLIYRKSRDKNLEGYVALEKK